MRSATFAVDRLGEAAIVRLHGDLRVDQVPEVYEPLSRMFGGERVVIVDLSDVSYIDSAGIASMVGLYKRLASAGGGRLVLCGAREEIWGVFRTMKLDRLFSLHPSLPQALEAEGLVDKGLTRG